jgi:hypothetical protein
MSTIPKSIKRKSPHHNYRSIAAYRPQGLRSQVQIPQRSCILRRLRSSEKFGDVERCWRGNRSTLLFTSGEEADTCQWRERRAMLNPMFSKRAINDLTSRLIYPFVEKLCRHLDHFCDTQTPVPFDNATYCITVDIITAYMSGTPWNMLDEPGFDTKRLDSVRWFTGGSNVAICFPWTRRAVQFLNWCFPGVVLEGYTQMFRVRFFPHPPPPLL